MCMYHLPLHLVPMHGAPSAGMALTLSDEEKYISIHNGGLVSRASWPARLMVAITPAIILWTFPGDLPVSIVTNSIRAI